MFPLCIFLQKLASRVILSHLTFSFHWVTRKNRVIRQLAANERRRINSILARNLRIYFYTITLAISRFLCHTWHLTKKPRIWRYINTIANFLKWLRSIFFSSLIFALVPLILSASSSVLGKASMCYHSPLYKYSHSKEPIFAQRKGLSSEEYNGSSCFCEGSKMMSRSPLAILSSISVRNDARSVHAGLRLTSSSHGFIH